MIGFLAGLGGAASLAGAVLLYLAAPKQRVLPRMIRPRRGLAVAGWALQIVALVCFLQISGAATAVFIWITLAMTFWSLLPLTTAWRDQGGRK